MGTFSQIADLLGIHRSTLFRLLSQRSDRAA
ncbi:helix-turn-helix domain-containing protein [Robbsia andropogonis]